MNATSPGSFESHCGALFDAVSSDGSNVVFTSPDPEERPRNSGCGALPQQIYERVDGSSTVDVSKQIPAWSIDRPHPVQFEGASADGSKVFFTTTTGLTRDDEGRHDEEFYEYDVNAPEGERLTRISRGTTETVGSEVNNFTVHIHQMEKRYTST